MTKRPSAALFAAQVRARKAKGLSKKGPRRIPFARPPDTAARTYLAALRRLLSRAHELVRQELVPELPRYVERAAVARADAAGAVVRHDQWNDDLKRLLRKLKDRLFQEWTDQRLFDLADRIGTQTSDFQREQLVRQIHGALSIDVVLSEPWLEPEIDKFTRENVSLIKTIPSQYFDELGDHLQTEILAGERPESLVETIQQRYGVSESRAALIARDQAGKLYSDLNAKRQESLGVTSYTSRSMNDNRVCAICDPLDGQVFPWDAPPPQGHPGHRHPGDRCVAEPNLDDFWASIGAE